MSGILDPVLGPLLSFEPIVAIAIISLALSLMSILATKFMTNQKLMAAHRAELKEMQKKMKELKDDTKKMMAMQSQMMEKNMTVMKESFKPMIITIIPFLLIFAWLNANMAFIPIGAGEEFTVEATFRNGIDSALIAVSPADKIVLLTNSSVPVVDGKAEWKLKGEESLYTVEFSADGQNVTHDLVIGDSYTTPLLKHSGAFKQTTIGNNPLKINLLGMNMGWIWVYIIFSMIFSMVFRKVLKIS